MADDPRPHPADQAPDRRLRIPPLVWIVIAILIGWLIVAVMQHGGADRTPQGGTAPRQREGTAYMPAAPPTNSAPGTPAGAVNGPQEPGRK